MTHVQDQVGRHRHPVSHHPQTRIYNPSETNGRKATRNCQNDGSCDWRGPRSAPRFTHLREVTQVSSMSAKLPIWSGMTNMGARGGRLSCTCVLPLAACSPPKKCSSRPFVFLFYLIVRRAGFPTHPIMQPAAQTSVAIGGKGSVCRALPNEQNWPLQRPRSKQVQSSGPITPTVSPLRPRFVCGVDQKSRAA